MRPAVAGAVSTSDGRVTRTRRLCVCACSSPACQHRRLADAGGPFEDQRRRRRPVEEPTDGLHLGLATKDVRDGHGSGVGGVLPQNQRQRPTISPRRALRSSPDGVRGVVSKLRPMADERTGT